MRSNYLMSLVVIVAIAAMLGCGGSSTPSVQPVSVSVSPAAANLLPGQTQQFNATVTGSSNTAVTWSVVGGGGTIDSSGLFSAPTTASSQTNVTITATAAADTTKSANASATLVALTGLTVNPRGPALSVGGNKQLTVMGTFSDGTKHDWTNQSAWSSADTTVASVGATTGITNGAGVGVTTVTATYGSITAATAVNVTNMTMSNANLNGHYAFFLSHADIRGQAFEVGSFVADGNGNINSGNEDINAAVGSTSPAGLSVTGGTYSVYHDGRGTLTLITARGRNTYTFILSSASTPSTSGRIILSGNSGVFEGTLEREDPTAFAIGMSGSYAFLLGGMDGVLLAGSTAFQNPETLAGQFSTSTGTISGGLDANVNGVVDGGAGNSTALPFTATYSAVDGNGRGTFVLTPPSSLNSTATWTFAFYVVSANKVLVIQTDQQSSPLSTPALPALVGTAELQQATFSNADVLNQPYTFLLERSASSGVFGAAGQWKFDPANVLSGEMDINKLGVTINATITNVSATATYGTVAANGRGTVDIPSVSASPAAPSLNSAVFYLISPDKMYILETDGKTNGGVAEKQTNAATLLTGTLAFNLAQLATGGSDSSFSGQAVTNLTNLSGIMDSNVAINNIESQASSVLTGSCNPTDLHGRGTAALQLGQLGTSTPNSGFYLVTPTKMVVFGLQSAVGSFQAVDGVIENQ